MDNLKKAENDRSVVSMYVTIVISVYVCVPAGLY